MTINLNKPEPNVQVSCNLAGCTGCAYCGHGHSNDDLEWESHDNDFPEVPHPMLRDPVIRNMLRGVLTLAFAIAGLVGVALNIEFSGWLIAIAVFRTLKLGE